MMQDPARSPANGPLASGLPRETVVKLQPTIEHKKRVSPVDFALQLESYRFSPRLTKQFIEAGCRGNRPTGLARVKNGQRDNDRARPR